MSQRDRQTCEASALMGSAAASASRAARRGISEPIQPGERRRFVLLENTTWRNRPDLVLEHHRQQLMFDCHGRGELDLAPEALASHDASSEWLDVGSFAAAQS